MGLLSAETDRTSAGLSVIGVHSVKWRALGAGCLLIAAGGDQDGTADKR